VLFLSRAELLGGRQFHKSRQLFIRTHNEALTVAAMRICNEVALAGIFLLA
jgi:hypothetical protein